MANVFSKPPPPFDGQDKNGSLQKTCDYLQYMVETLDFQLGQVMKQRESQVKEIVALEKRVTALEGQVVALAGQISALGAV